MLCMGIDPLLGYSSLWRSMRRGGDRDLQDFLAPHPNPNVSIFTVSNQPFSGW